MATKSKPNKWADLQFVLAAISLTSVLALWNTFAGPDRDIAKEKAAAELAAKDLPVESDTPEPVPAATMPPVGYSILFGGEAPKPQVIVVQNNNKGNGGGGGGGAVTSTSSS